MILILSDNDDQTTNLVIDWIGSAFIRLNSENFIVGIQLELNSDFIRQQIRVFKDFVVDLSDIKSFWYRRDDFVLGINSDKIIIEKDSIKLNLEKEWHKLKDFIHCHYESKNSIGSFNKEKSQNKLTCLLLAQKIGLQIPPTLVTTDKSDLLTFINQQGECITKSIDSMFQIQRSDFFQVIGTQLITNDLIDKLGDSFFPTLVQKRIEKAFELRIFYLKGVFYAMAIFSQLDERTSLDYRDYNRAKPNRNVPYILPNDIEVKLKLLMDKLDINTGSIDIMVTPENQYVFLEVNPTGQFGWLSQNCNYYLEEKIAHCLENGA